MWEIVGAVLQAISIIIALVELFLYLRDRRK